MVVIQKNEATGLMAGVEGEVEFVNKTGDNNINGSGHKIHDVFVAAAFGTVHRKKRMARHRRRSSSSSSSSSSLINTNTNNNSTITIHLKNLPSTATTSSSHVPLSPIPTLFPSTTLPPARVSFFCSPLPSFSSFLYFRSVIYPI